MLLSRWGFGARGNGLEVGWLRGELWGEGAEGASGSHCGLAKLLDGRLKR